MDENFICNFYGTDIYLYSNKYEEPNILAIHKFENNVEKCRFSINDFHIINGYFSDDERYSDVKEWLKINKNELLKNIG